MSSLENCFRIHVRRYLFQQHSGFTPIASDFTARARRVYRNSLSSAKTIRMTKRFCHLNTHFFVDVSQVMDHLVGNFCRGVAIFLIDLLRNTISSGRVVLNGNRYNERDLPSTASNLLVFLSIPIIFILVCVLSTTRNQM